MTCENMAYRLFLQESEGFGDRLFLKQRMSLLSQLTSTPIDCLFQVRYGRSRGCRCVRSAPSFIIYLFLFIWLLLGLSFSMWDLVPDRGSDLGPLHWGS